MDGILGFGVGLSTHERQLRRAGRFTRRAEMDVFAAVGFLLETKQTTLADGGGGVEHPGRPIAADVIGFAGFRDADIGGPESEEVRREMVSVRRPPSRAWRSMSLE